MIHVDVLSTIFANFGDYPHASHRLSLGEHRDTAFAAQEPPPHASPRSIFARLPVQQPRPLLRAAAPSSSPCSSPARLRAQQPRQPSKQQPLSGHPVRSSPTRLCSSAGRLAGLRRREGLGGCMRSLCHRCRFCSHHLCFVSAAADTTAPSCRRALHSGCRHSALPSAAGTAVRAAAAPPLFGQWL